MLPIELTTSTVEDRFYSPKTEIDESDIGSPSIKSEKPDPTDPSNFPMISYKNQATL